MAYTHIQCIGYQVPTVAKVFNNTAPVEPTIPTGKDVPVPKPNSFNNNGIGSPIYNTTTNQFYPIPDKNTNPNGFDSWNDGISIYISNLIYYLEDSTHDDQQIRQNGRNTITYLKYHTHLSDWTIPSGVGASGDNAVQIVKVQDRNNQLIKAYDLKDPNIINANLTLLDDPKNIDAKNRVIRFLNVLYQASRSKKIDTKETTLKVFTAPEFYFRPEKTIDPVNFPEGNYRAYTEAVYKAIRKVLEKTTKNMGLNHWLIVPGTIMWYLPKNTQIGLKSLSEDTYFNSSIYIYNYPKHKFNRQTSHKLEKTKASNNDGVPYSNWDYGKNAPRILNKYRDNAHLNKHLFTINGVKTGLEICLEHTQGAMNRNSKRVPLVKHVVDTTDEDNRHLQLLVAGGMDTKFPSVALQNKGVFFRNDGLSNWSLKTSPNPKPHGTYDEKYVDARKPTVVPPTSPLHLPALTAADTISLTGDAAFELQAPATLEPQPPNPLPAGPNLMRGAMPFDQQKIMIFPTQEI